MKRKECNDCGAYDGFHYDNCSEYHLWLDDREKAISKAINLYEKRLIRNIEKNVNHYYKRFEVADIEEVKYFIISVIKEVRRGSKRINS